MQRKPKRLEAVYIEGKPYCPLCKTRNWKIINYSLADSEHKHLGMFKFEGQCQDCGNIVVYYKNI